MTLYVATCRSKLLNELHQPSFKWVAVTWPEGREPVASFTKEVNRPLAKRPLVFNGRLANRELTSLVKEATGLHPNNGHQSDMSYPLSDIDHQVNYLTTTSITKPSIPQVKIGQSPWLLFHATHFCIFPWVSEIILFEPLAANQAYITNQGSAKLLHSSSLVTTGLFVWLTRHGITLL